MKFTLHRKTNYIEFISGLDTNATNKGEKYVAMKSERGWIIYDEASDTTYSAPIATLRVLIEQGKLITQYEAIFSLGWKLKFGL